MNTLALSAVITNTFVIFWFIKWPSTTIRIMKFQEGIIIGMSVWLYVIAAFALSLLVIFHANP